MPRVKKSAEAGAGESTPVAKPTLAKFHRFTQGRLGKVKKMIAIIGRSGDGVYNELIREKDVNVIQEQLTQYIDGAVAQLRAALQHTPEAVEEEVANLFEE